MLRFHAFAMSALLSCSSLASAGESSADWSVAVPNWTAPAPGEHPRLFFRKNQLDAIKKRAETPEGKAIVERLKVILNGSDGKSLPPKVNPLRGDKEGSGDFQNTGVGGELFTMFHPAGYGMLYQLTGDKAYADLARKGVEMQLDGVHDMDDRYSFANPHGALRAGPSLGAMAMAYDLNFDGWEPAFREKIAREMMTYNKGPNESLDSLALGKRHGPHSNHWGCQIGGAAMALLAIKGDPGADDAKITQLLAGNRKCYIRQLDEGMGETGYFKEHFGPGQIGSDTAFVPGLQAWYNAGGVDFYSPRTTARYQSLRWPTLLTLEKAGGGPWYLSGVDGGSYGNWVFDRHGLSRAGHFSQGFFGLSDDEKAAMLWSYKTFVEPNEQSRYGKQFSLNGKPSYDAISYPHRAVLALINWPIGIEPKNPKGILPQALGDRQMGWYTFRNRWQDADDIQVGALLGARSDKGISPVIYALGMRHVTFGNFKIGGSVATHFVGYGDGSGVVTGQGTSLAVDFNPATTCDGVLVMIGSGAGKAGKIDPAKAKEASVTAGATTFSVLMLSAKGTFPTPAAAGDTLTIGTQVYSVDKGKLVMKTTAAPYAGAMKLNP